MFQHPRFPTKYQGTPTIELDREWEALYNRMSPPDLLSNMIANLHPISHFTLGRTDGIFYVGKEEARQLKNSTVAVPAEEHGAVEQYPMSLDVFHQLHCLVRIRLSTVHRIRRTVSNLSLT